MSRKNIAKNISTSLPGNFNVNKGIVYATKHEYIIRGFLLEGTAYKATRRLHEFTFALFRTHKFIHLGYCKELKNPNTLTGSWFEGDDDTIVADALAAIHASGSLDDAIQGCSPSQFLQRYEVPDIDDVHSTDAFDLACAAGLCGDLSFARHGLESARQSRIDLARLYEPYSDHEVFLQTVAERLEALDQGFDVFKASLQKAATVAAAAHGFSPPSFDDAPGAQAGPY